MARLVIPDEPTTITFDVTTSQDTFPFDFAIFSKVDLRVKVGGSELDQSAFTLAGTVLDTGGYQGGVITLNTPAVNESVVIFREVVPARAEGFGAVASVPVSAVDQALNRQMAVTQDLKRAIAEATGPTDEQVAEIIDPIVADKVSDRAQDNFENVDPLVGRTALGVAPPADVIADGLIYDDPSKALQNWAKLQAAQSNLPDGAITNVVIPRAKGTLHVSGNVLNSLTKLANWVVPNGVTLSGGDLYVDRKDFWDASVPFEITTNRTGIGTYQATYRVRHHEDASTGPGSGDRFYYKKSGLSTTGFNIARTTLADFRNLDGGVGLCDWRLTVCQPKSGPGDSRTFFVYDSEINVVNLWADQGYERNIYGMANPVGGVFFVPEAQDFVEGRGGGYNVQFAFMLGHSGGNSPATGEKMKTYIGYGAAPNSIAAGGGLLVASGNNGDTGNGGGTSTKDPGFAGQFWDTWDTGWDFSNATFRSGIYEKLPAGAKTKYGTGDFVSVGAGVRTFQSGATLYRETLTPGHMVLSTDGSPLWHQVNGFYDCIGSLGGGYFIDGVRSVGPRQAAVEDATDAASCIAQLNTLLARLRTHGLIEV